MRFLAPYILIIFSQLGAQTAIEPILTDSIALQTDYFAGLISIIIFTMLRKHFIRFGRYNYKLSKFSIRQDR